MLGFAPLSAVPLSSLPATGAQAATGFVSGSFGTPLAGYARTQTATGATPSTAFGTAKFGTTVAATGIAPNTKLGAPPKFGPNILQIVGNGADGETTFADESPYYAALTRNGSIAKSTAQSRFGTGSISLTGASTANNIAAPSNARFNLTGDQFTIEAEVYLNAYNASGGRLLGAGGGASGWSVTNGFHWLMQSDAAGVQFSWLWYGYQGGYWGHYVQTLSATLSLSTWAQVKVTCDGTGTVRLFLDGALIGSLAKPPTTYTGNASSAVSVSVGALPGEATGATFAANAYIQQIRIRTDCTDTVAFSAPTAGLPSWIGELAGIAPTTQVPTPKSGIVQPATGFTPTLFGTGFGQNLQRPTGFQSTAVGDPRIFPYSPPPILSTTFGTGRLFPYHVAPGINATGFGSIVGWQSWRQVWGLPKTLFGTPSTPTNRSAAAHGSQVTRFGLAYYIPSAIHVGPGWACRAFGSNGTVFGAPKAAWPQTGLPAGGATTVVGLPTSMMSGGVAGFAAAVLGSPTLRTTHFVAGAAPLRTGHPTASCAQKASGPAFPQKYGLPSSDRSNTYKVYGINAPGRIGHPTGACRFNYSPAGFSSGYVGNPACFERHRARSAPPGAGFGRPLLRRNTQC